MAVLTGWADTRCVPSRCHLLPPDGEDNFDNNLILEPILTA